MSMMGTLRRLFAGLLITALVLTQAADPALALRGISMPEQASGLEELNQALAGSEPRMHPEYTVVLNPAAGTAVLFAFGRVPKREQARERLPDDQAMARDLARRLQKEPALPELDAVEPLLRSVERFQQESPERRNWLVARVQSVLKQRARLVNAPEPEWLEERILKVLHPKQEQPPKSEEVSIRWKNSEARQVRRERKETVPDRIGLAALQRAGELAGQGYRTTVIAVVGEQPAVPDLPVYWADTAQKLGERQEAEVVAALSDPRVRAQVEEALGKIPARPEPEFIRPELVEPRIAQRSWVARWVGAAALAFSLMFAPPAAQAPLGSPAPDIDRPDPVVALDFDWVGEPTPFLQAALATSTDLLNSPAEVPIPDIKLDLDEESQVSLLPDEPVSNLNQEIPLRPGMQYRTGEQQMNRYMEMLGPNLPAVQRPVFESIEEGTAYFDVGGKVVYDSAGRIQRADMRAYAAQGTVVSVGGQKRFVPRGSVVAFQLDGARGVTTVTDGAGVEKFPAGALHRRSGKTWNAYFHGLVPGAEGPVFRDGSVDAYMGGTVSRDNAGKIISAKIKLTPVEQTVVEAGGASWQVDAGASFEFQMEAAKPVVVTQHAGVQKLLPEPAAPPKLAGGAGPGGGAPPPPEAKQPDVQPQAAAVQPQIGQPVIAGTVADLRAIERQALELQGEISDPGAEFRGNEAKRSQEVFRRGAVSQAENEIAQFDTIQNTVYQTQKETLDVLIDFLKPGADPARLSERYETAVERWMEAQQKEMDARSELAGRRHERLRGLAAKGAVTASEADRADLARIVSVLEAGKMRESQSLYRALRLLGTDLPLFQRSLPAAGVRDFAQLVPPPGNSRELSEAERTGLVVSAADSVTRILDSDVQRLQAEIDWSTRELKRADQVHQKEAISDSEFDHAVFLESQNRVRTAQQERLRTQQKLLAEVVEWLREPTAGTRDRVEKAVLAQQDAVFQEIDAMIQVAGRHIAYRQREIERIEAVNRRVARTITQEELDGAVYFLTVAQLQERQIRLIREWDERLRAIGQAVPPPVSVTPRPGSISLEDWQALLGYPETGANVVASEGLYGSGLGSGQLNYQDLVPQIDAGVEQALTRQEIQDVQDRLREIQKEQFDLETERLDALNRFARQKADRVEAVRNRMPTAVSRYEFETDVVDARRLIGQREARIARLKLEAEQIAASPDNAHQQQVLDEVRLSYAQVSERQQDLQSMLDRYRGANLRVPKDYSTSEIEQLQAAVQRLDNQRRELALQLASYQWHRGRGNPIVAPEQSPQSIPALDRLAESRPEETVPGEPYFVRIGDELVPITGGMRRARLTGAVYAGGPRWELGSSVRIPKGRFFTNRWKTRDRLVKLFASAAEPSPQDETSVGQFWAYQSGPVPRLDVGSGEQTIEQSGLLNPGERPQPVGGLLAEGRSEPEIFEPDEVVIVYPEYEQGVGESGVTKRLVGVIPKRLPFDRLDQLVDQLADPNTKPEDLPKLKPEGGRVLGRMTPIGGLLLDENGKPFEFAQDRGRRVHMKVQKVEVKRTDKEGKVTLEEEIKLVPVDVPSPRVTSTPAVSGSLRVAAISAERAGAFPELSRLSGRMVSFGNSRMLVVPEKATPDQLAEWVSELAKSPEVVVDGYGGLEEDASLKPLADLLKFSGIPYVPRRSDSSTLSVFLKAILANLSGLEESAVSQDDVASFLRALRTAA